MPGLLHFTLDPYLITLSVKQGGNKYHFLSFGIEENNSYVGKGRRKGDVTTLKQNERAQA